MVDELQQRLWAAARDRAEHHQMPFEAGAEQYLGQALTEAAQRMADTGAVDPGRIREAERNTERLVDAMAAVARELGFGEFHEPTFFGARDRLCPGLWPFC